MEAPQAKHGRNNGLGGPRGSGLNRAPNGVHESPLMGDAMDRAFCRLFAAAAFIASLAGSAAAAPETVPLQANWRLASADHVADPGEKISRTDYAATGWYPIRHVPATVLEILQEDGVYPNLYYGENLLKEVPQDLYKQDWWYRTSFTAPRGQIYWLDFPGINYRAEIWLNGKRIADNRNIAGMYVAHTLNVTDAILPGQRNMLAVKVTPERAIQDVSGVELADSWFDWLNGKYVGYKAPPGKNNIPTSFVPDRNAGIFKPVTLRVTGPVRISHPAVTTALPLPNTAPAALTVYAVLENGSSHPARGRLVGQISRPGKPDVRVEQPVGLNAGESREVFFTPDRFPQLTINNPDLWWPYTLGKPDLYNLKLTFQEDGGKEISDLQSSRFGIRVITQHRDKDEQFPELGKGGNFYLQVNGKDFLARGAVYTPDLLYRDDPTREVAILRYVKDLGLNMLRWESKISSEHIVDLADEAGIPLMYGWMCCNQWEKWDQWNDEDQRVARDSVRSQILMLRSHPAAFIWANGSDGHPPDPVLRDYHHILSDLHWQNAVVDTVSSFAKDSKGDRVWSGIIMEGPYSWRPPSYWFSGLYPPTRGASAEQGDNEEIPPYESLKKFIPPDKLWPINEYWSFHAGATDGNNSLRNIQRVIEKRYGPANNAEEFAEKAQLAHYENARAQFEDFGANGWANHKMTIYWMLNNHWPSFFGHIFDYYLKPGGAYFGAKMGLKPVSVVFDYYSKDKQQAHIRAVNQTLENRQGLSVRVRVYNLDGTAVFDRSRILDVSAQSVAEALTLPILKNVTPVYFVRCQLFDASSAPLADNVYWQAVVPDKLGLRANDNAFNLQQEHWADFTPLQTMAKVHLDVKGTVRKSGAGSDAIISLHNSSSHLAFFVRAEMTAGKDGNEILPVTYDNNYVTVFPGETVSIHGAVNGSDIAGRQPWIRIEGYNSPKELTPIR